MTLVDLSQVLSSDSFHSLRFPPPRVQRISTLAEHGCNATLASFTVHCGTHVDAPSHFFDDGSAIDEIAPDRLHGPARAVRVDRGPRELITVDDLRAGLPDLEPDTIVCVNTGWDAYFDDHERYRQYPYLSMDAARWLLDRRIKMLAVDAPSPDMPEGGRPDGFDWPVHRLLLGNGVLVAEHLRGLAPLVGRRFRLFALPVALRGADGAPARIVAET